MEILIGIDPGLNGGIVAFVNGKYNDSITMPKTPENKVDIEKVNNFIAYFRDKGPTTVVIENVHSIFGSSSKSNFSFGYNCGLIRGCLACIDCTVDYLTPRQWQKLIWEEEDVVFKPSRKGTKKKVDTKATSANAAKRIFPKINLTGSKRAKKPHDGIVDALLIAEAYGRS